MMFVRTCGLLLELCLLVVLITGYDHDDIPHVPCDTGGQGCSRAEGPTEASKGGSAASHHLQHTHTEQHNTYQDCDSCRWMSPNGAYFDLSSLCGQLHTAVMEIPANAKLSFSVCGHITCGASRQARACIEVPGNKPTVTGSSLRFELMEQHVPSTGVRLVMEGGAICDVTQLPRRTFVDFECVPSPSQTPHHIKAWEAEGSDICNYYVKVATFQGCPSRPNKYAILKPQITAVTGCVDSVPRLTTSECNTAGGTQLTIHGLDFMSIDQQPTKVSIVIHNQECVNAQVVSPWKMTCELQPGSGDGLPIQVTLAIKDVGMSETADGVISESTREMIVISTQVTVSYKQVINYRHHFDTFADLGVGGLSAQIKELYQRAFASRGVPGKVLQQLGIDHAKGILLYGPPGSGKTLLARTIAKILKTNQVKLVNAPEIMSKYLGESEKNLRHHFEEAEKAWAQLGEASDLYVIVIDEIDAVCKPRGKSDSSAAAAAYDSVVNQLLTKMDGLRSIHNILVIGMTNRRDLIDAALLRPGRFEVQIEIGLPDEEGRWEIFYIHTRDMRRYGYLAPDVNLRELASNSSQFSGAEIAGVVRLAASYALDRKYGNKVGDVQLQITQEDLRLALIKIKPAYTQTENQVINKFLPHGFLPCGRPHDIVVASVMQAVSGLQHSNTANIETVLLYGARGVGKSGIAAHIANKVKFSYIKFFSVSTVVRLSDEGKMEALIEMFQESYRSPFSLIVLDDLQQIVNLVTIADQLKASHELLSTLTTLMTAAPPSGCKLFVIGTVLSAGVDLSSAPAGRLGLQELFNVHLHVANINAGGAFSLLDKQGIKRQDGGFFAFPPNFSISLRNLLKVTDCVGHEAGGAGPASSSKLTVTQEVMDTCLARYPHVEPVSFNI